MRILLIQGYLGRREPPVAPIGLAVLAAHVQGHDIQIFDPNIQDNAYDETACMVDSFSPDLIGLSLRNIDTTKYSDQFLYFNHFKKFIKFVKGISGDSIMVVGGSGFSLFPLQVMESIPEIDIGFYLEGENSFKSFIDSQFKTEGIPGIYFRNGNGIEFTGIPDLPEIDHQPHPAWDLLDIEYYNRYTDRASIGVETKRGCSMKCAYCTYPVLAGNRVRTKTPKAVVDEIELLKDKFGVRRITFTDPVFNYPLDHAEGICREIIDRKLDIEWTAYLQDRYLSAEYIKTALKSGCVELYLSPDSATETGMKILGKSSTVGTLDKSLNLIFADGEARAAFNFFAAVPGTGWRNFIAAVIDIIKAKIKLKKRLLRFKFSYIRIEPGTPLAHTVCGEKFEPADLFPHNSKQLNNLYYRKSTSFFLNILLTFHYYSGKFFGRRNLIRNR